MPVDAAIYTVSLPEYTVDSEPDYTCIGEVLDAVLVRHFSGDKVALRGISLADHPGKSLSELAQIIALLGTDRYDPNRKPVLNDFYAPYQVDLHALPCTISQKNGVVSSHAAGSVMAEFVSDFYNGPPVDRQSPPLRVDLLLVYDYAQLEPVFIDYGNGPESDPCEFRFKRLDRKPEALLGIVLIEGADNLPALPYP